MADTTAAKRKRIRRTPADLRAEALAAARRLIAQGAGEALTMRAVADEIGVTYPNLSHHFGSAAGLQAAVAQDLVRELLDALAVLSFQVERPLQDPRAVVDITFDLFEEQGLGRLLGWLARSRSDGLTDKINSMVDAHVTHLERRFADKADGLREMMQQVALIIAFTAYAETSVGGFLGDALQISEERRREIVARALTAIRAQLTELQA